jgi:serine/threonine protein kinase
MQWSQPPTGKSDKPKSTLDDYEFIKKIGEGSYGHVFLAKEKPLYLQNNISEYQEGSSHIEGPRGS